MRFRWLQPTITLGFFNKESYDRIRSLLVFSSEFLHFRRTEFSTDGAVTRIEFQLSHLKDFKLKQRSASFGIQRNFKLNKDSQTEIFSLVSAVSNPKEPKTSTNFCILCAVREELTYICRVCLTKVYPLFSDREEFILCSCRQGRLSSVFRQGRLALRANFWFILCSFRQGRLALRANFWFILCSFRQGRLALRANFWFILCSFRQGRFWHYVLKNKCTLCWSGKCLFCLCGTEETCKMVRRNARLIPTTEKSGLATPLWSDSEFKTLLGEHMDLIVTEKVRQKLTQKYEIHPDKTWLVDECKKVLGASIRKNNVKDIICCHREFSVTLATQQSQRNAELEKQNNELCARIYTLTKKLNLKKEAKTDVEVSRPDNFSPDLQAFFETDVALQSVTDVPVNSVHVCGARRRSQGIEDTDGVPLHSSVVQIQTAAKALCPKDIERLSQSLPSARTHFSEFRRTLISKMRLYDMSLTEVTQLMSQILTESEFNSFESAVTSELRNASKGDLREGILKILKNILGPKIDWSRITTCVQRKEETVSEYTERFCQSAVIYSGIVDDPESVLDDKGPLVRIWSDGLVAEYRKALPFLDLTWSNRTLRSNLDRLTTWERDADVKAKVRVAAATFNTTKQDNRWSKRESKCKYCEKFGHWEKECRKKLQDSKRNAMHNSAPSQPAHNPEVVPPVTTETIGQLVQALLRAQQDQEKN